MKLINCPTIGSLEYIDRISRCYPGHLFHSHAIRPTGADASHQNGPVEQAHLTVANAIRACLIGVNLEPKFWPHAFHHFLRVKNSLNSSDKTQSPLQIAATKQDDFSGFRAFGCRVHVRPPGHRSAKFRHNTRKGIFLGFLPNTTRNIMCCDPETNEVKVATRARFDEGMNDLPADQAPPNVQHLQRSQFGEKFPSEPASTEIDEFHFEFHFVLNPFSHTLSKTATITCRKPDFGLAISDDELSNRAFVWDFAKSSTAATLVPNKTRRAELAGAHIVSINDMPVFDKADALSWSMPSNPLSTLATLLSSGLLFKIGKQMVTLFWITSLVSSIPVMT